jgi:hypothetical protein
VFGKTKLLLWMEDCLLKENRVETLSLKRYEALENGPMCGSLNPPPAEKVRLNPLVPWWIEKLNRN